MSLPLEAVERLFTRLTATYGAAFTRLYAGQDASAVKSAWAWELAGFASRQGMQSIAWALENLPEQAPNVIQFRNLCRQATAPEAPRLPQPPADPERVRAELARLQPLRDAARKGGVDHRAWARRIVAKHTEGLHVNRTTLHMAQGALAQLGTQVQV